jgi:hypothetical protein
VPAVPPRKIPSIFSTPSAPMPYSSRSRRRMVRKRLGPGGRKAFQSCRNVRRAEGGGSAPALLSWQSFRPSGARLTIHRRNPCPLCRSAPAGSRGGDGNGPVAGRLADAGKGVAFKRRRPGAPGSPTQGQARVGECRTPFQAARVRAAKKRHALPVGCGHHPAIIGSARGLRHPVHAPRMHTHTNLSLRRQPARGPPDPVFLSKPRRHPARDYRPLSIRKSCPP